MTDPRLLGHIRMIGESVDRLTKETQKFREDVERCNELMAAFAAVAEKLRQGGAVHITKVGPLVVADIETEKPQGGHDDHSG